MACSAKTRREIVTGARLGQIIWIFIKLADTPLYVPSNVINLFPQAKAKLRIAIESCRVRFIDGVVRGVRIEVHTTPESSEILTEESAGSRIQVARPIEVESCFRIEFPACVLEWIRQRTAGGRDLSERIVGVRLCRIAG